MRKPLRLRSRSEQKAVFSGLYERSKKANSYNGFSDSVNSEFKIKFAEVLHEPFFPTDTYLDSLEREKNKKKKFSYATTENLEDDGIVTVIL